MARSRRARATELTESWDEINDHSSVTSDDNDIEDHHHHQPQRFSRTPRRNAGRTTTFAPDTLDNSPRRRGGLRSSVEPPELVMPSSPDGGGGGGGGGGDYLDGGVRGTSAAERAQAIKNAKMRASTPHFRLNERSLTSDAGHFRKTQRSDTPRFRMGERSMTSDAGRFQGRKAEYGSDEDEEDGEDEGGRGEGKSGGMDVVVGVWRVVRPVLQYGLDVLAMVFNHLKPILALGFLAYLVVSAVIFAQGFMRNSISQALSPICRLPFTSGLSFCPATGVPELQGAAEFDKLVQAQDAFQDVLASTSVGVNLPLDMKRSEAGIRDLKQVVQYSHLPSRNELVLEFSGFIDTAREASQLLSRFNSRIGRAVDHILSTNRWTLTVIDGVNERQASSGSVVRWVNQNLNIFAPFQPINLSQDVLLDQYLRHTNAVEEQILTLIAEAQVIKDILDNLDNRLDVIAGIATRDGIRAEANRDELFASLWTQVGGNRASVAKVENQLQLLKNVGTYRRAAWGHITSTILKLQDIQHSLEDLRERVALPEIVGIDTVPLEVHIENINLGIQRLEKQRDASREIEAENRAKVISRAEINDRNMIAAN